tara:strand:+ start:80 stop:412 length:333 start_codon:yes stop_codon:yes gene_type:complete
MTIPQLNVSLTEKVLSVQGKKLQLDDTLFSAEVSRILNEDGEYALTFSYEKGKDGEIISECENIYSFLEAQRLTDRQDELEVTSCGIQKGIDFPNVSICGRMKATIHSSA